jgi:uncharacterized protein (TIGR00251 family)
MDPKATAWPCLAPHPEGVMLSVKVSPNAQKTGPQGLWNEKLRVRVQAPPVDGQANKALRQWAAKFFGLRFPRVELLRGEKSHEKLLLLRGLTPETAAIALAQIGGGATGPSATS